MQRPLLVLSLVSLFTFSPLAAQTRNTAPKAAEAQVPRLTMPLVLKVRDAAVNLSPIVKADPTMTAKVRAEKERLRKLRPEDDNVDLEALGNVVRREPKLAGAFARAGITPEAWFRGFAALMGATIGATILEGSQKVPPGVEGENINFVRRNRAQVEPLLNEINAALPDEKQRDSEAEQPEEEPQDPGA